MAEPRSWEEFIAALAKLVGNADDTDGSQSAGSLMAKQNAILEALLTGGNGSLDSNLLEKIYRSGLFFDPTINRVSSITFKETLLPNTNVGGNGKLIRTETLEHDFVLLRASCGIVFNDKIISGQSTDRAYASYNVIVDAITICNIAVSVDPSSNINASANNIYYYNNLLSSWNTYSNPTTKFIPVNTALERNFLFPKGTKIEIYSTSKNQNTSISCTASGTLTGYYVNI